MLRRVLASALLLAVLVSAADAQFVMPGERARARLGNLESLARNAPFLRYFNAPQADIQRVQSTLKGQISVISGTVSGVFGSGSAIVGSTVQNIANDAGCLVAGVSTPGACATFPPGLTGYAYIGANGASNFAYPVFGRGDLNNANGSMTSELDCNNVVANSPTTMPPNLNSPATGATCIGLQVANIGAKNSTIGLRVLSIGQIGGPSSWVTSFYADPPAAAGNVNGIRIDANSNGPQFSGYFQNPGTAGNVHMTLQTTTSGITANPVFQHVTSTGLPTFQILQTGEISAISTGATPLYGSPLAFTSLWTIGDGVVPGISLDSYGASSTFSFYSSRGARGTAASPVALNAGDTYLIFAGTPCVGTAGVGGTCTFPAQPVRIQFSYTDSGSNSGSQIIYSTTPNGSVGAGARAIAAVMWGSGGFSAGTNFTDPGAGVIKATTSIISTTGYVLGSSLMASSTAPTVSSGFCTTPSVVSSNGTAAFAINTGAITCGGSTGSLTMPTAATAWTCHFDDVTNPASNVVRQTGGTATTVTVTNYAATTGLATNFGASTVIRASCVGY